MTQQARNQSSDRCGMMLMKVKIRVGGEGLNCNEFVICCVMMFVCLLINVSTATNPNDNNYPSRLSRQQDVLSRYEHDPHPSHHPQYQQQQRQLQGELQHASSSSSTTAFERRQTRSVTEKPANNDDSTIISSSSPPANINRDAAGAAVATTTTTQGSPAESVANVNSTTTSNGSAAAAAADASVHEREFISAQVRIQMECQRDKTLVRVNFTKPFNGILGAGKPDTTKCKLIGNGGRHYELQVNHNSTNTCDSQWDSATSSISNTLFIRYHQSLETGGDLAKHIMCRLKVGDIVVGRRPSKKQNKLTSTRSTQSKPTRP